MRILDDFIKLIANAHNNTRMYDDNGFTPFELASTFKHSTLEAIAVNRNPIRHLSKQGETILALVAAD